MLNLTKLLLIQKKNFFTKVFQYILFIVFNVLYIFLIFIKYFSISVFKSIYISSIYTEIYMNMLVQTLIISEWTIDNFHFRVVLGKRRHNLFSVLFKNKSMRTLDILEAKNSSNGHELKLMHLVVSKRSLLTALLYWLK